LTHSSATRQKGRIVTISVLAKTWQVLIRMLAPSGALLTKTVMMPGASFGTVFNAAPHFRAVQPSHSDDFGNALERIGLDTSSYSVTRV
jgi:hypothetical protein